MRYIQCVSGDRRIPSLPVRPACLAWPALLVPTIPCRPPISTDPRSRTTKPSDASWCRTEDDCCIIFRNRMSGKDSLRYQFWRIQNFSCGRLLIWYFLQELCFSADGRLVCSPYGYGVRLLSFTDNCSELPTCVPKTGSPVALTELWKSIYHDDYVVTAKFSPRHFMLATGCLSGRIIWYQPRA